MEDWVLHLTTHPLTHLTHHLPFNSRVVECRKRNTFRWFRLNERMENEEAVKKIESVWGQKYQS